MIQYPETAPLEPRAEHLKVFNAYYNYNMIEDVGSAPNNFRLFPCLLVSRQAGDKLTGKENFVYK